jgi:DNA-binding NarL/FixJ family response regulator
MFKRVPPSMRNGWSFFEKSGEMSTDDYVKIIKETAVSKGNWEEFASLAEENVDPDMNRYYDLSSRQRSIIALMAQGVSVQEIGTRLDLSYAYVRKELSRAYSVLLPDAQEGEDFKTLAILKYLQLAKSL